jgi:hypothetical protein
VYGITKQEAFDRFNDSSVAESSCPAKLVKAVPIAYVARAIDS